MKPESSLNLLSDSAWPVIAVGNPDMDGSHPHPPNYSSAVATAQPVTAISC